MEVTQTHFCWVYYYYKAEGSLEEPVISFHHVRELQSSGFMTRFWPAHTSHQLDTLTCHLFFTPISDNLFQENLSALPTLYVLYLSPMVPSTVGYRRSTEGTEGRYQRALGRREMYQCDTMSSLVTPTASTFQPQQDSLTDYNRSSKALCRPAEWVRKTNTTVHKDKSIYNR